MNIPPQNDSGEGISFLELNKFLTSENVEKDNNNIKNKLLKKRAHMKKEILRKSTN